MNQELRDKLTLNYYDENPNEFEQDMEKEFQMENWPKEVKEKLHWLCWQRGHSSGYCEVYNEYHDLIDLINICFSHEA